MSNIFQFRTKSLCKNLVYNGFVFHILNISNGIAKGITLGDLKLLYLFVHKLYSTNKNVIDLRRARIPQRAEIS